MFLVRRGGIDVISEGGKERAGSRIELLYKPGVREPSSNERVSSCGPGAHSMNPSFVFFFSFCRL